MLYLLFFGFQIDSVTQGTWIASASASYPLQLVYFNSTAADGDEIHFSGFMGAGTYTLKLLAAQRTDNGIVKIYIDGDLVGTFDKYGSTDNNKIYTQASIVVAASGVKDIKMVVDGKHASSTNHYNHFISLSFYRTA